MKRFFFFLCIIISCPAFAQTGIMWSAPQTVASSTYSNLHPRVTLDASGNPLILWGNDNTNKAYFSRWNGMNFTLPVALNPASIPVFTAMWAGPDIASRGNHVYVVYKQTPEQTNHIFLVHSTDGGIVFTSPVRVDNISDTVSRFPAVTTDASGNPLVAFMKFDSMFMNAHYVVTRSSDYGMSFSQNVLASGFLNEPVCDCCPASIVASGTSVAVLYRDNNKNNRSMWAGVSSNGGNTFNNGMQVDKTNWNVNACPSSGPDGVIVGDSLITVFMSSASGKGLCYMSVSSLSTGVVGASIPLTENSHNLSAQNYPRIASQGKAAAIAWKQTINNVAQLGLLFTNNISAGLPQRFDTVATGGVENTDVALGNGTIHIVWEDGATGTVKYRKGMFTPAGIQESLFHNQEIVVYPNPVSNNTVTAYCAASGSSATYSITNLVGQELLQGERTIENGAITIDLSTLSRGMFFLRIVAANESFAEKILKQ